MDAQFLIQKENGKIKILRQDLYDLYCQGLAEGERKLLVIKSPVITKTSEQLGYYHGVIKPLCTIGISHITGEKTTYTDTDQILSRRFLTVDKGKVTERVKSKADLSRKEMSQFINECIRFAAVYLHVIIPDPGEYSFKETNEDDTVGECDLRDQRERGTDLAADRTGDQEKDVSIGAADAEGF